MITPSKLPVLIIGNITCDVIINVKEMPQLQGDVMIDTQSMHLGGCAYNVANLFHLHELPYHLITVVGSGLYGNFIRQELEKQGFQNIRFALQMHGCCYCFVDSQGERSFIAHHGIEYSFHPEWMKPYQTSAFSCAYVCGLDIEEAGGKAIIHYLQKLSCPIVFAPGPRCKKIDTERLTAMYALRPILHLNEKEAYELSGKTNIEKALIKMQRIVHNLVIITLADKGSVAIYNREIVYVNAESTRVVDTIGAGDAHIASVMIKLLAGNTLREALAYANHVSAKVVANTGASFTKETFDKIF